MSQSVDKIVFYDGECGFCNRSVAFVLKNDRTESIHFASIQSNFTKQLFDQNGFESPDLSTFYFFEEGVLYQKSTAAMRLAKYLKFPKNIVGLLRVVPRILRDSVYKAVAKRRRSFSKGFCVLPTEKQKKLFLD